MDLDRVRWLTSAEGRRELQEVSQTLAGMPLTARLQHLRRRLAPEHASVLSQQIDLRARALTRFGYLPLGLYSESGLEMMTHPLVARRRAARLAPLGLPVADLTCGIGGDLAALAAASEYVLGFDTDPVAVALARHNVPLALVAAGAAIRPPVALDRFAVVLDPARRSGLLRRFDPSAFSPSWDVALDVASAAGAAALKGPPGLPALAIPPAAEVEFVQLGRSMRETALYLGGDAQPGLRRAVVLPEGATIDSQAPQAAPEPVRVGAVMYDPAPAVTLAGLVRHLALQLDARLIDPHIAYLTGQSPIVSRLAYAFEVVEVVPFSVARVRQSLARLGLRPHEIRRRAFPIEPDELRRLLGPLEGPPVSLLCCTIDGKRTVIVARPIPSPGPANA